MGCADLKHDKSSTGISTLASEENHLFLFAAGVMNLDQNFCCKFKFNKKSTKRPL